MRLMFLFVSALMPFCVYAQFHRLESVCGVKSIVTINKMFKGKEVLRFNPDCLVASKHYNGYKLQYSYRKSSNADSVLVSNGDLEVYLFDPLGRFLISHQHIGAESIISRYEYDSGTNRLNSRKINSLNFEQLLKYSYNNSISKYYNKIQIYVNKEIHEEIECDFDKSGNMILFEEFYHKDGQRLKETGHFGAFECSPCEYDYDSKGNWTRKYQTVDGKRKLYAVRRIRYK